MDHVAAVKYEISENLSSLWAMKRAWKYYARYVLTLEEALATRKGTKKRKELERKASMYIMHYYRMFITYGIKPTYNSLMLSRMNACRLELGYRLIPISERVDRIWQSSEVF